MCGFLFNSCIHSSIGVRDLTLHEISCTWLNILANICWSYIECIWLSPITHNVMYNIGPYVQCLVSHVCMCALMQATTSDHILFSPPQTTSSLARNTLSFGHILLVLARTDTQRHMQSTQIDAQASAPRAYGVQGWARGSLAWEEIHVRCAMMGRTS